MPKEVAPATMIQRFKPRPEGSFADDDCLIVADTHTHIYPCYNLELFFQTAFDHLGQHARLASRRLFPSAMLQALFLSERADCTFFQDLVDGRVSMPDSELTAEATLEPEGIVINREENALLLIQGFQVATAERLELLALATAHRPEDGQSLDDTVCEVLETGGIPVLPWAPGKWFFNRGRMVIDILHRADPDELLLGDSSLRPRLTPAPRAFRAAEKLSYTTVHGSDPLPFAGEEKQVASYASAWVQPLNEQRPVDGLRQYLRLANGAPQPFGNRNHFATVLRRLLKNHRARRVHTPTQTPTDA